MTASSSVSQPKGIVMKQEQCVESKCSKNFFAPGLLDLAPPPFYFSASAPASAAVDKRVIQ